MGEPTSCDGNSALVTVGLNLAWKPHSDHVHGLHFELRLRGRLCKCSHGYCMLQEFRLSDFHSLNPLSQLDVYSIMLCMRTMSTCGSLIRVRTLQTYTGISNR